MFIRNKVSTVYAKFFSVLLVDYLTIYKIRKFIQLSTISFLTNEFKNPNSTTLKLG